MTAGADCKIKIWDTRKMSIPLLILNELPSMPLQAKYNPNYD